MPPKLLFWRFLSCLVVVAKWVSSDFNHFSDNVLYQVNWAGSKDQQGLKPEPSPDHNTLLMNTIDNERYVCSIPADVKTKDSVYMMNYDGPTPRELLEQLFTASSCSYRIESYWSYELCHGRHIRQYHEEKEPGKGTKLQEYYLGLYKSNIKLDMDMDARENRKMTRVDNVDFPFVSVNMTEGTKCDINGQPRQTRLMYICHMDGKGEMYEVKETSSCHYDVVIFSKLLCGHPAFRQKMTYVNMIQCHSLDGTSRRPKMLDSFDLESARGRHVMPAVDIEPTKDEESLSSSPPPKRQPSPTLTSGANRQIVDEFLGGSYCLTGGQGWWMHEFCFARLVRQYHDDRKTAERKEVVLGLWDPVAHTAWMSQHQEKRYVKGSNVLYQQYTQGDFCDLIGTYRTTLVTLRCTDNPSSPTAVSLYLTEPSTCQYKLVVESQMLCSVIKMANREGIIENKSP